MSILSSNILTLCPQCNNNPLLYLNQYQPKDIFIQCAHCEYNQYTSLHKYLYQLNTISHIKRNDNDKNVILIIKYIINIVFNVNYIYVINVLLMNHIK